MTNDPGNTLSHRDGAWALEFHPKFLQNRLFYVLYRKSGTDTRTVIEEWTCEADLSAPRKVREIEFFHRRTIQSSGDIRFGPDGYLYSAQGDRDRGADGVNLGDVGEVTAEEVNLAQAGKNYGAGNIYVASSGPHFLNRLRLDAPRAGESMPAGKAYTLKCRSLGDFKKAYLKYDDGATWKTLAESVDNTRSYEWTPPANHGPSVRIKVMAGAGFAGDAARMRMAMFWTPDRSRGLHPAPRAPNMASPPSAVLRQPLPVYLGRRKCRPGRHPSLLRGGGVERSATA